METMCCHGNQSSQLICPKTLCSLSSYLIMVHKKLDQDWPAGSWDILRWKCWRRTTTNTGPWAYYYLTAAFGSGELECAKLEYDYVYPGPVVPPIYEAYDLNLKGTGSRIMSKRTFEPTTFTRLVHRTPNMNENVVIFFLWRTSSTCTSGLPQLDILTFASGYIHSDHLILNSHTFLPDFLDLLLFLSHTFSKTKNNENVHDLSYELQKLDIRHRFQSWQHKIFM